MILSTYLVECIMQRVDFFLRLLFAETMLKIRIRHYLHNLFNLFFFSPVSLQVTYTFMHLPPDDDESVCQRTQAGLVLRLRRRVAAEHPLYVETQHKSQETASLTALKRDADWLDTCSHTYSLFIRQKCE